MWVKIKDGEISYISNNELDKKELLKFLKEKKEYSLFRRLKYEKSDALYGILSDFCGFSWEKINKT